MSLSVVPVANLTNGDYLAGILDSATTSKLWTYTPYSSAAVGDAEAPALPEDSPRVGFFTVDTVKVDAARMGRRMSAWSPLPGCPTLPTPSTRGHVPS